MANVTPQSSGSAQGSVRASSQAVQQGGAGATNAMGNLGAILASVNQQIAKAFMQQQQQYQQDMTSASQAGAKAVEDMANKISSEQMRQKARKENLADSKTMTDYNAMTQQRQINEQRDFAAKQEAMRADEAAAIESETGKIQTLIQTKMKQIEDRESALNMVSQVLADPNNGLSPEKAREMAHMVIDTRKQIQGLYTESVDFSQNLRSMKPEMSAGFAHQRAGMDPNPGEALGPKPRGVSTGNTEGNAMPPYKLYGRKSSTNLVPKFEEHQPVPDPMTTALALQMDVNNQRSGKAYNLDQQTKKLKVGIYKFKERLDALGRVEQTFRKHFDAGADDAIQRAFLQAEALPPDKMEPILNAQGQEVGQIPKATALNDLMMTNLLEPFGTDKVQMWRDYREGKLKIDTEDKMAFGVLVT